MSVALQDALVGTYKAGRPVLVGGKGARLTADDGRELLDFVSGIGVNALGYGSPVVENAIAAQMRTGLLHASNLYRNEPALKLAQMLTDASFADKVFFCNSGAEANEAAFKFARRHAGSGKHEIVALKNSFHGRLFGSLAATDRPSMRAPFEPLMPGVKFILAGDYDAAKASVSKEKTAAIIVEPIQGEGGVQPIDAAFLQFLRELATANDAALIFDEVQCGMGRTGTLFAYEQSGVIPDIVTMAKPLAGGLPMGATLVSEKIAASIKPGDHATTFGGGALVSAVACAVFETVSKPDFLAEVTRKGYVLASHLHTLAPTHARGVGLMWGLELDKPAAPLVEKAFERGLLICTAGENVIRLLPPLIISDEEIGEAVEILSEVVQ